MLACIRREQRSCLNEEEEKKNKEEEKEEKEGNSYCVRILCVVPAKSSCVAISLLSRNSYLYNHILHRC